MTFKLKHASNAKAMTAPDQGSRLAQKSDRNVHASWLKSSNRVLLPRQFPIISLFFTNAAMRLGTVQTDGYYASGPVEWEDWHAGVLMRETHHHFWRFYSDGNWVCCHRFDPEFAFWQFAESLTSKDIEKAKQTGTPLIEGGLQLFVAGTYAEKGDSLTTFLEWRIPLHPSGEQAYRYDTKWRIVGDCIESLTPPTERLRFVAQSSG